MVPPPISQAGRFKPRKPAKKVRPPDSLDVVANSSTITAPALNVGRGFGGRIGSHDIGRAGRGGTGRGRDGRGRDGRGRDGRGRDGRGRFALPQGQVFFTATPATSGSISSTHRKSSHTVQFCEPTLVSSGPGQNKTSHLRRQANEASTSEEIVGTLDEAIGSGTLSKVSSASDYQKLDPTMSAFEHALLGDQIPSSVIGDELYDTDSSDESKKKRFNNQKRGGKAPLSLPFPSPKLPVGFGAKNSTTLDRNNTSSSRLDQAEERRNCAQHASPFVNLNDDDGLRFEKNNFFLVQLPTRLPRLKLGQIGYQDVDNGETAVEDIANVATPAMQTNSFDNALTTAASGRLGKIQIYKSGRTILVLEGPDGAPAIDMKVSEGLKCGFRQMAVSIDLQLGEFLPLGSVEKTVVVTPDIGRSDSAFF